MKYKIIKMPKFNINYMINNKGELLIGSNAPKAIINKVYRNIFKLSFIR